MAGIPTNAAQNAATPTTALKGTVTIEIVIVLCITRLPLLEVKLIILTRL